MGGRGSNESSHRPDESEAERLDRNYGELLQELRVLQAGMQILFAFLLSLPFQSQFTSVTDFQQDVYVATLVAASLATACIVAPVAFHRIVFRRGMKADLMRSASRFAEAGLALLFASMTGALLLVLDFLLSRTVALALGGGGGRVRDLLARHPPAGAQAGRGLARTPREDQPVAFTARTGHGASSSTRCAVLPMSSLPTGVRLRRPITIRSARSSVARVTISSDGSSVLLLRSSR